MIDDIKVMLLKGDKGDKGDQGERGGIDEETFNTYFDNYLNTHTDVFEGSETIQNLVALEDDITTVINAYDNIAETASAIKGGTTAKQMVGALGVKEIYTEIKIKRTVKSLSFTSGLATLSMANEATNTAFSVVGIATTDVFGISLTDGTNYKYAVRDLVNTSKSGTQNVYVYYY